MKLNGNIVFKGICTVTIFFKVIAIGMSLNATLYAMQQNQGIVENINNFKLVGEKPGGAVPGALYQKWNGPDAGTNYIIKYVPREIAFNEILASELYKATGLYVADFIFVNPGNDISQYKITGDLIDKEAVAKGVLHKPTPYMFLGSKMIAPLSKIQNLRRKDVLDGFLIDAWLGNYDVIGARYDNILDHNGKSIRLDVGASLKYQGTGQPKGPNASGFNEKVNEVKFLRGNCDRAAYESLQLDKWYDPYISIASGNVFNSLTKENILVGKSMLEKLTDDQIREIVYKFYNIPHFEDLVEPALAELLIARKNNILIYWVPTLLKEIENGNPQINDIRRIAGDPLRWANWIVSRINPYFTTAYTEETDSKSQKTQKTIGNQVYTVLRPNNGLAHAMRQGFLAVDIINVLAKANPDDFHSPDSKNFIVWLKARLAEDPLYREKIQLIASFQGSGRQSERSSPALYAKYENQDVANFLAVASQLTLFSNPERLRNTYAKALLKNADPVYANTEENYKKNPKGSWTLMPTDANPNLRYLNRIIWATRTLDLIRLSHMNFNMVKAKISQDLFGFDSAYVDANTALGDYRNPAKPQNRSQVKNEYQAEREIVDYLWSCALSYADATGDRVNRGYTEYDDKFYIQSTQPSNLVMELLKTQKENEKHPLMQ